MLFSEKSLEPCTRQKRLLKQEIIRNIFGPLIFCLCASCSNEQTQRQQMFPITPESVQPSEIEQNRIQTNTEVICDLLIQKLCGSERGFSVYVDKPNEHPGLYRVIVSHACQEPEYSTTIGIEFGCRNIYSEIKKRLEPEIIRHLLRAHSNSCYQRLNS